MHFWLIVALIVSGVHFCGKKESGGQASATADGTPVETDELPF